eukprot:gene5740-6642_t
MEEATYEAFVAECGKRLGDAKKYYVGVDIGGTNTRVICGFEQGTIYLVLAEKASRVNELLSVLKKAEDKIKIIDGLNTPEACCIDIAGPTSSKVEYTITNYEADAKQLFKKDLPTFLCPEDRTYFINDLESGCYGLVYTITLGLNVDYFKEFIPAEEKTIPNNSETFVVLAAGTGLGVGVIHHQLHPKDKFTVIPAEFGHINISPLGPNQEGFKEEEALLNGIIPEHDKGRKFALEYEDIVSGRGLVACHVYYKGDTSLDGEKIARTANSNPSNLNCPCVKALTAHYRYLIRASQELAVGLNANSVYLLGDNVVHNSPFIQGTQDLLVKEFKLHPKSDWIKKKNVMIQKKSANLNLYGTIYYARNILKM